MSTVKLTELQWINFLQTLDTNFIFLFGKKSAGKSAILATLIHTGNNEKYCPLLKFVKDQEAIQESMYEDIRKDVFTGLKQDSDDTWSALNGLFSTDESASRSYGFLPIRTEQSDTPLLLSGVLSPTQRAHARKNVNITFLEVAGETVSKVGDQNGTLPSNMNVYFKASGVPLMFFLIVDWIDAEADDLMVSRFIDYVRKTNARHKSASFVLLITKWDKFPRGKTTKVHEFVNSKMPNTWSKIQTEECKIFEFSIGTVEPMETDEFDTVKQEYEKRPYIQNLNTSYSKILWENIYSSFSDEHLIKPSFFKKFKLF